MAGRTWDTVAMPILRWCDEHPGADVLRPDDLAGPLGVSAEAIDREVDRLIAAGYMTATRVMGPEILLPRLTERGLRATGAWPAEDPFSDLVAMIEAQIAATSSEETRSKLEAVRDSVVGLGRDAGVNLFSAWVQSRMGL